MKIHVTKAILAKVQDLRGKVNTDTGKVFVGVQGSLFEDGFYHLEVIERDLTPADKDLGSFSLSDVTTTVYGELPQGRVIDKTMPIPPLGGPAFDG